MSGRPPRDRGVPQSPAIRGEPADKAAVRDFWDDGACGEVYAQGATQREQFDAHAAARYALEPFIPAFAQFGDGAGRRVLEIGVGMGADHLEWARSRPALLAGIDLTERAIAHTRSRLQLFGGHSLLHVGDAENLPFPDGSFDIVYSWGVVHHSPDTVKAVAEIHRVLRPGGRAAVMIYHRASVLGAVLWLRYGLLRRLTLDEVYARYLESPGTRAYSVAAARRLFAAFRSVEPHTEWSPGDLMLGAAGQRHGGALLRLARRVWPRRLIRRLLPGRGLFLLIAARK